MEVRHKTYWSGIGSRSTPAHIEPQIKHIASLCSILGLTLRTGGAAGADTMFAKHTPVEQREIWLPTYKMELIGRRGPDVKGKSTSAAYTIAESYHPKWNACTLAAKDLHARNSHIVLGSLLELDECQHPVNKEEFSKFVCCWTKKGEIVGGTGQGIRVAHAYCIPVFNLGTPGRYETLVSKLEERIKND